MFKKLTESGREQEQEIAAITQRNSLPVYLETTKFLKRRRPPPAVDDPMDSSSSIVVYANHGVDRNKHQFVLSHALSQAAVHPIFFSHLYEYVRVVCTNRWTTRSDAGPYGGCFLCC
jgi:hypothetical protein